MNLLTVGRLLAKQRKAQKLTLPEVAQLAGVARSTVAALESGKLRELGFNKVVRLCTSLGLVVDVRTPLLKSSLMDHRHITDLAGRELTKAAIDDVLTRGDISAWRGLARAIRDDESGRLAGRVQDVLRASAADDPKARAFAALLPRLKPRRKPKRASRG